MLVIGSLMRLDGVMTFVGFLSSLRASPWNAGTGGSIRATGRPTVRYHHSQY